MPRPRFPGYRGLSAAFLCAIILGILFAAEEPRGVDVGALMEVRPGIEHIAASSGNPGGPFTPSSVTYTVKNSGAIAMDWTVTKSQPWISLSTEGGTLNPGERTPVTVSLNELAMELTARGYIENLVFTNLTSNTFVKSTGELATGPTTRLVTLNVLRSGESLTQGFGATTPGGSEGTVFHVTTTEDNGDDTNPLPGSIRDALSQGDRYIVFDVAGDINLKTFLYVRGGNITIDGFTARSPGITLKNYGIILRGRRGAHDVIVRGLRIRDIVRAQFGDSLYDGVQIFQGAFNIVLHYISGQGADDENVDVGGDSHDVTVAWSILAQPKGEQKNVLIKYNPWRVSLHHNLFVKSRQRNPQVAIDSLATPATETTADIRNNLIWDFGYGTLIRLGAWANVVNNYYSKTDRAIRVQKNGKAYVSGNETPTQRTNINRTGNKRDPFPAPPVDTADAKTAACQVLTGAGVRPLDDIDRKYLSSIIIPECHPVPEPPTVSITGPVSGSIVSGLVTVSAVVASASGIAGVRFFLDELALGEERMTPPYMLTWDTASVPDGRHTLHARVRDTLGNSAISAGVNVIVDNAP